MPKKVNDELKRWLCASLDVQKIGLPENDWAFEELMQISMMASLKRIADALERIANADKNRG